MSIKVVRPRAKRKSRMSDKGLFEVANKLYSFSASFEATLIEIAA